MESLSVRGIAKQTSGPDTFGPPIACISALAEDLTGGIDQRGLIRILVRPTRKLRNTLPKNQMEPRMNTNKRESIGLINSCSFVFIRG